MASTETTLIILVSLVAALASSTPVAEPRPLITNPSAVSSPLALRLKLEGSGCWESLFQLQACTGEIIMFFLNGETYLGQGCCQAIRVVGHDCWPNVVGSLGFTDEETDILQGFCDGEVSHAPPPAIVS
ncbi:hypothetical protein HN51_055670 [Arachis hypogaea]|uniref:Prolamin-like domain-containing protein n=2 Tax=Arachis hypogaea TaxID=3818 RepID=A0A444XR04_ARAHY|nr:egg cell-secreted protein 1.1-like [Arachis ipaensis]XP_025678859.1 egg cell-secreted protein 1.1-like [Arachis hypogaea]RYQ92133.1 hypothetical protein Ahy_B09g098282 isoform A [Arachis hypogaea]